MLQKGRTAKVQAVRGHFAIVASRYNARYVEGMLRPARRIFAQARVDRLEIIRVPGAFEIPAAVAELALKSHPPLDAILCLGVILRGETTHAQHIGEAVTLALAQVQLQFALPVIHEVLLLENEAQARVRCLGREHNRGAEAARTALEMARVMSRLKRARFKTS